MIDTQPSNDLADWYPLLVQAGVPTPATEVIDTDIDLSPLLDGVNPDRLSTLVEQITDAAGRMGFPAFLRTGYTAAKHDFARTCFLRGPADVLPHIAALVERSSLAADGLPLNTWVVREMLPIQPAFIAYGMPVTAERRYYFNALGQVTGHHPHWSPQAIAAGNPRGPRGPLAPEQWSPALDAINHESEDEVTALTEMTQRIAARVLGAWSVDYLWTADRGWVVIDMAHLRAADVWHEHPSAPFLLGRPIPEPVGPVGPGVGGPAGAVEAALLAQYGWSPAA